MSMLTDDQLDAIQALQEALWDLKYMPSRNGYPNIFHPAAPSSTVLDTLLQRAAEGDWWSDNVKLTDEEAHAIITELHTFHRELERTGLTVETWDGPTITVEQFETLVSLVATYTTAGSRR